jgi:hypothetical protein
MTGLLGRKKFGRRYFAGDRLLLGNGPGRDRYAQVLSLSLRFGQR